MGSMRTFVTDGTDRLTDGGYFKRTMFMATRRADKVQIIDNTILFCVYLII